MDKKALVKNTDSKKQVREAKKKVKRKLLYKKEYMKEVLSTYAGRKVLFEIIGLGGIYREHLGETVQAMSFRCGESAVAKKVIGMMNEVDPNAYPKMIIEANEDLTEDTTKE